MLKICVGGGGVRFASCGGDIAVLLFAPLVGLGYLSGNSDNITMIARPASKSGLQC